MARSRPVASAVVRRAQVRAALDDLLWNPHVGRSGVVASVLASAARILRDAASFRRVSLVLGRIPVGGPFPDIPDHVMQAVAIRRERIHRRSAFIAILVAVLV